MPITPGATAPGRGELEEQTVDADQQQDESDVGIGDDGQKPDQPAGIEQLDRHALRRQLPRFAAGELDLATVDQLKQFGRVARDEIDDIRLQCAAGGKAGGFAHGFLGPIGVAPAQFGEAADQRDRVVGRLRRRGILQGGLLRIVFLVLAVLFRSAARQPRQRATDLRPASRRRDWCPAPWPRRASQEECTCRRSPRGRRMARRNR